jgi:L-threonylcarbamoyladenylate synthase
MSHFEEDVKNCIKVLEQGGTILYPTDTVWGIGCNALDENAVDKVFDLKQRPRQKSLIVLLADARDIIKYVAAPHPDIIDIVEGFDVPTTVVYEAALGFPENAVHEDGTIAIRVTNDPFCKALIKRYRNPIVSTSANLSGEPTPDVFARVSDEIKRNADYVVQHRQNDAEPKRSSRLVKINEDGSLEILRP